MKLATLFSTLVVLASASAQTPIPVPEHCKVGELAHQPYCDWVICANLEVHSGATISNVSVTSGYVQTMGELRVSYPVVYIFGHLIPANPANLCSYERYIPRHCSEPMLDLLVWKIQLVWLSSWTKQFCRSPTHAWRWLAGVLIRTTSGIHIWRFLLPHILVTGWGQEKSWWGELTGECIAVACDRDQCLKFELDGLDHRKKRTGASVYLSRKFDDFGE